MRVDPPTLVHMIVFFPVQHLGHEVDVKANVGIFKWSHVILAISSSCVEFCESRLWGTHDHLGLRLHRLSLATCPFSSVESIDDLFLRKSKHVAR